ncbi:Flagellar motor switch protein FliN-like C-terminal domain-containing protein [Bordetella sputigena]|uniref:type III secretion system cytoplasmic ring protein SctQ n=1 Tax=Bordetella sputigena TaxID=1416810 RepID=UPI0039EE2493
MSPICAHKPPMEQSEPFHGENTPDDAGRSVALDWNGARLSLRLSSRACDEWIAMRMPDLDIAPLPPRFLDAAWETMVRDAIAALGIARLCPGIQVLGEEAADPPHALPYAWTVIMQSPGSGRSISARLAVDELGLQGLGDLLDRMPARSNVVEPDVLDALPIRLAARAGETALESGELRRLEIGDVVLFDRCLASPGGNAWLVTPDGQAIRVRACEPGASRYVVTQEWSSLRMNDYPAPEDHYGLEQDPYTQDPYAEHDQAPPPRNAGYPSEDSEYMQAYAGEYAQEASGDSVGYDAAPPVAPGQAPVAHPPAAVPEAGPRAGAEGPDVDRIPVHLVFDLGDHNMALGELRRLRPGEFFDLHRRIDAGPVHIRANGTLIGTAELVDIDGRIGARVLTLFPGRDSWA